MSFIRRSFVKRVSTFPTCRAGAPLGWRRSADVDLKYVLSDAATVAHARARTRIERVRGHVRGHARTAPGVFAWLIAYGDPIKVAPVVSARDASHLRLSCHPAPGATMAAMSPAAIESLAGKILASASLGPHAVFSLRPDAGRDAFKARYRELARALHPDKAKSRAAEEAFKVVTESFRAVEGGGCPPPRAEDGPRGNNSRAPFWRVREEDAAAAPPRWSAGAGAREAEKTRARGGDRAAPRWSAAATGAADADPRARAFEPPERHSRGRRSSDARARGENTRKPSSSPEPVEPDVDDDPFETDPSPTARRAWFDLDRSREAMTTDTRAAAATARWNDAPRGRMFFSGAASSARTAGAAAEDPAGKRDPSTLEDDPPRGDAREDEDALEDEDEDEDGSCFGGERAWAAAHESPSARRTAGGWGTGAAERSGRSDRSAGRSDWRGARFAAPSRRAPPSSARAAGFDFSGFDVADVGDPSELERLACGDGTEANEPGGGVSGVPGERAGDDRDDRRAGATNDDDAEPNAAFETKAKDGRRKPARAVSRKRGRSKKAAESASAAPRPRLAALDEPRIPHTRLPRKKFAQATLAFS